MCALLRLSLFTEVCSQTLDQAVGILQLKHASLLQAVKSLVCVPFRPSLFTDVYLLECD